MSCKYRIYDLLGSEEEVSRIVTNNKLDTCVRALMTDMDQGTVGVEYQIILNGRSYCDSRPFFKFDCRRRSLNEKEALESLSKSAIAALNSAFGNPDIVKDLTERINRNKAIYQDDKAEKKLKLFSESYNGIMKALDTISADASIAQRNYQSQYIETAIQMREQYAYDSDIELISLIPSHINLYAIAELRQTEKTKKDDGQKWMLSMKTGVMPKKRNSMDIFPRYLDDESEMDPNIPQFNSKREALEYAVKESLQRLDKLNLNQEQHNILHETMYGTVDRIFESSKDARDVSQETHQKLSKFLNTIEPGNFENDLLRSIYNATVKSQQLLDSIGEKDPLEKPKNGKRNGMKNENVDILSLSGYIPEDCAIMTQDNSTEDQSSFHYIFTVHLLDSCTKTIFGNNSDIKNVLCTMDSSTPFNFVKEKRIDFSGAFEINPFPSMIVDILSYHDNTKEKKTARTI